MTDIEAGKLSCHAPDSARQARPNRSQTLETADGAPTIEEDTDPGEERTMSTETTQPAVDEEHLELAVKLPAPMRELAEVLTVLRDRFKGAAVENRGASYVVRIPSGSSLSAEDDTQDGGDADDTEAGVVYARDDMIGVNLGEDIAKVLVAGFKDILDSHDAPNYVTMSILDETDGRRYEVEIRRPDGMTTAEKIAELEAEIERLRGGEA